MAKELPQPELVSPVELGEKYLSMPQEVPSTQYEQLRKFFEEAEPDKVATWVLAVLVKEIKGLRQELQKQKAP
jgi:hypothetical protein